MARDENYTCGEGITDIEVGKANARLIAKAWRIPELESEIEQLRTKIANSQTQFLENIQVMEEQRERARAEIEQLRATNLEHRKSSVAGDLALDAAAKEIEQLREDLHRSRDLCAELRSHEQACEKALGSEVHREGYFWQSVESVVVEMNQLRTEIAELRDSPAVQEARDSWR